MPPRDRTSLRHELRGHRDLQGRFLWGARAALPLGDLDRGSTLSGRLGEIRGRSVLLSIDDPLLTAAALVELDGVVSRLVLCPPDLPREQVPYAVELAEAHAVVTDRADSLASGHGGRPIFGYGFTASAASTPRDEQTRTEWVLVTSGTTGPPKMVVHTLSSLAGAIAASGNDGPPPVWATFYDIRRFGGLQVLLRAILGGTSLVLSDTKESVGDFLVRAGARGTTHVLGTPTHWRHALMSPEARRLTPRYVRLSGEIADQSILDQLGGFYPGAKVVHAFASTEAGVVMEIADGLAGFPAHLLGQERDQVEMRVEAGSLRVRSPRTGQRYLGPGESPIADGEGYVDTGDIVEQRGERYHFVGRRGGIINVGGLKIHPEEVETRINAHPKVRLSLVKGRKSPITGALVVAEVVLKPGFDGSDGAARELEDEIIRFCAAALPRHKVPTSIRFVSTLDISPSGKIGRSNA